MEEQKKKGILTRSKRKLEMDDVPIAYMEEQKKKKKKKKKKKGNGGKRKLEMDDVPITHMEQQQQRKRKIEMDDVPITHMEQQQQKKKENLSLGKRKIEMDDGPIAYNKRWKLTAHGTATASPPHQKLPHGVIVDNILTRLPIRNLAKECALVCKLWYKSIMHPHFAFLHALLQSACRNPNLIFDLLNTTSMNFKHLRQCTLRLDIDDINNDNDVVHNFSKLTDILSIGKQEPVGHCNGLQCLRSSCVRGECFFHITNPSCRPKDFMVAVYPVPDKAFIFCCGFGFDSLVNEYKIVLVYSNSLTVVIDVHDKFKCMVFSLEGKSWRESSTPNTFPVITTVSTGIIQEKKKKVLLSRMSFSRSAIYVSGALYWRVLTREEFGGRIGDDEEEETEMLLCFDIHHEQFQLISLPLECELKIKTGTATITTKQEQQLIDHRLLEFEGSPCIVRLQTGRHQQRNSNCCCKVYLYVLKDRVKSAWSIEIFDVCNTSSMIKDMSNPPPCVITLATSSRTTITTIITTATTVAAVAATTTKTITTSDTNHQYPPVTRILCVYGRVILYWFDGVCVQLYDLRKKRLKMVNYTPANGRVTDELFDRPGRGQLWPYDNDDVDITTKLIYCRRDNIDYKLHIYVENCLPLKTFMPKGCTILQDYDKWLSENKDIADVLGFVYTVGKNGKQQCHCFRQRLSTEGSP